jgi:hypothetical protein
MTKRLLLLLVAIITFSACKKNDENTILLNSTAYLDSAPVLANYAVISELDSGVIRNENTVETYFKNLPKGPTNVRLSVKRFAYFVPPGNYIIVIQIDNALLSDGKKTYTYKRVLTTEGEQAPTNIMYFMSGVPEHYQKWVNKE